MKYLLAALFLVASVVADVSHLSNEYLPPLGQEHHHHHHHQHAEYAEQTNEAPQLIGANTYTPQHLLEPSNSLEPEASQPEPQQIESFPSQQAEDVSIDQSVYNVDAAQATQEQEVAYQQPAAYEQEQSVSFQFGAAEEQQPAAQQFVPQTFGDIFHSQVSEQGPAGVYGQEEDQQYQAAASSSSSIDTQYGSNGGYVY